VKVSDVIRASENDGWRQVAQRGSHRQFKHSTKVGRVTVAGKPSNDLVLGTLNSVFEAGRSQRNPMMRYAVVTERADGNYAAYVPDLPGCVAAGPTIQTVEQEIREAIRFHIDGMHADGLPVPEPSSPAEYVETSPISWGR
jgi:predicted RNase H-like HicB family nuclease/predicted RNA binding protein YcfA (HicA-like mRNA interferase family)